MYNVDFIVCFLAYPPIIVLALERVGYTGFRFSRGSLKIAHLTYDH